MCDAAWLAVPRRRAARPQQRVPPAAVELLEAADVEDDEASESDDDEDAACDAFTVGRGSPDPADDVAAADEDASEAATAPRAGLERGAAWGRVPNPWWRAPLPGALRRHERFRALPPAADVAIAGEASLAFLRQDSGAWAAAHAGRLTTGALLAALGCREPQPARRIGLPPAAAGRRHAAAAAARMREAVVLPPPAEAADVAGAAARNAAAVADYNARLARGEACGVEEEPEADADVDMAEAEAEAPAAAKPKKQRRAGKKGGKGASRRAAVVAAAPLPPPADAAEAALRAAGAAAASGGAAVRCAWGSAQEGGTLWALLAAFPEAQLREVGLLPLPASVAAEAAAAASLPPGALATLPRLGASPDALCAWPRGSRFAPPGGTGDCDDVALEVVEVKNVCPFREAAFSQAPAGGGKRRGAAPSRRYALSDAGPHAALPAAHVPQLQLQMACAGTRTGLLVVESATKGMAVWRMERDDAYLGAMLSLLASFNARFGGAEAARPLPASAGGPGAPESLFPASGADGGAAAAHAAFLRRNAALARGATMLDFIAQPRRPPDADARPFLD